MCSRCIQIIAGAVVEAMIPSIVDNVKDWSGA